MVEELEDIELIEMHLKKYKEINPMALESRILDLVDWIRYTKKTEDESKKIKTILNYFKKNSDSIKELIDPDFLNQYPEASFLFTEK